MKKYIWTVLILSFVMLCGCQNNYDTKKPAGQSAEIMESIEKKVFPENYQASGEHVEINIERIKPREAGFVEGIAKVVDLDYEEIGRKIIPEEEIGEVNVEAGQILSKKKVDDYYDKIYIWGEDNFEYFTYHSSQLFACIDEERKSPTYNLPIYKDKKDFSFGTAEDSFVKITEYLNELGIPIDDSYQTDIYYLSHEVLRQEEKYYDMDGNKMEDKYKVDWTEADDAYLFYIHQTYCELEDYHVSPFQPERAEESGAQIEIIYGKKGVLYLRVQNLGVYEMGSKPVELQSFENVADAVLKYFDNILDDASYEVKEAQLICDYSCEKPINGENILRPVWAFYIIETRKGEEPINYELRVDASTGKIIQ